MSYFKSVSVWILFFLFVLTPHFGLACAVCTQTKQVCTSFDENGNCQTYTTECTAYSYSETVTVSGQILSGYSGGGISGALVTLYDQVSGSSVNAFSDSFGYYSATITAYDVSSNNNSLSLQVCSQVNGYFSSNCIYLNPADNCGTGNLPGNNIALTPIAPPSVSSFSYEQRISLYGVQRRFIITDLKDLGTGRIESKASCLRWE